MRLLFVVFVVSIASFTVSVVAQNKEFCESFVRNRNQIDSALIIRSYGELYSYSILIIGRDYWVYHYSAFDFSDPMAGQSRRLPDWFDTECQTLFCVNDCEWKGALGCLKVIQFIFSFIC